MVLEKCTACLSRFKVQGCMIIVNSSQFIDRTAEDATGTSTPMGTKYPQTSLRELGDSVCTTTAAMLLGAYSIGVLKERIQSSTISHKWKRLFDSARGQSQCGACRKALRCAVDLATSNGVSIDCVVCCRFRARRCFQSEELNSSACKLVGSLLRSYLNSQRPATRIDLTVANSSHYAEMNR